MRLGLAADLAVRHQSHLTAFSCENEIATGSIGADRESLDLFRTLASIAWTRISKTQPRAGRSGRDRPCGADTPRDVDAEFCCIDGVAAKLVPQHARYAGPCIVGPRIIEWFGLK